MGKEDNTLDINNFLKNLSKLEKKGLIEVKSSVNKIKKCLKSTEIKEYNITNSCVDIEHQSFYMFLRKDGMDLLKDVFNCTTFDKLIYNINKISAQHFKFPYANMIHYDDKNSIEDIEEMCIQRFKGDLFEIFAEFFFKLLSNDSRVGISEYKPIKYLEDVGVDAIGIANNGYPCAIQIKYRSNTQDELYTNDVRNFQGASYAKYGVNPEHDNNLIIFTTCKGLHWQTQTQVLNNKVINYTNEDENSEHSIPVIIDENLTFWRNLNKSIDYNISNYIKKITKKDEIKKST